MFPQDGNFNVSAYKKLENEWADWIDTGMDVHITVELAPKQLDRPEQVRVAYEVTDPDDGRVVYDQRVTFRNEAGQQFDRVPRADMAKACRNANFRSTDGQGRTNRQRNGRTKNASTARHPPCPRPA